MKKIYQAGIVFLILVFPSLLYVMLTAGNHDIARLPYIGPKEPNFDKVDKKGIPDTIYYKIPPISLTDYSGNTVDQSILKGKHLVIDFVCTSCNEMSPRITSQMVSIQERFIGKDNIALLSIMIGDDGDSASAVDAYKKSLKVQEDDQWYFVSGTRDEIRKIGESLLLNDINELDNRFETNIISIVDRDLHIRGHFDGKQYVETKEAIDMIKALLFVDFKATKKNKKDEELVRRK